MIFSLPLPVVPYLLPVNTISTVGKRHRPDSSTSVHTFSSSNSNLIIMLNGNRPGRKKKQLKLLSLTLSFSTPLVHWFSGWRDNHIVSFTETRQNATGRTENIYTRRNGFLPMEMIQWVKCWTADSKED